MVNKNKHEYIARKDGVGKIIFNQEENHLKDQIKLVPTLTDQYPYLYEAFVKDGFLEDPDNEYAFMKEIVYDKKVVGFSVYRTSVNDSYILNLIYVLPKFRGNNLLYEDLMDTKQMCETDLILIDCPNKYVMDSLVKNKLAFYINEHIIISQLPLSFAVDISEDLKKKIEQANNLEEIQTINVNSPIYDTDICGIVSFESEGLPNLISPLLDVDIMDSNATNHRMNVSSEDYFKNLKKEIEDCGVEFS
ncbi:MAG: hypothetical protein PHC65_06815 [Methanobacteriaceae archaeon]|jgi:hypothetical protein|uniref:hypothetical protein n=1 Tax=unclassified Methanobrevibacter TaxID=2638681 RepID=UPI00375ABA01|nr:hypothetical protein [Methanobacteriaceae archaeon]MDD4595005.1 hypothetical protein [Methanobacteriaceae archaeon]